MQSIRKIKAVKSKGIKAPKMSMSKLSGMRMTKPRGSGTRVKKF